MFRYWRRYNHGPPKGQKRDEKDAADRPAAPFLKGLIDSTALVAPEPVPAAFTSPLNLLLETLEPILDIASLAPVEAAASTTVQPFFDAIGIVAKSVRHPVADPVTPIETVDLPLDVAKPHFEFANLAKSLAVTPTITLAITGPWTLSSRIILGCRRARCGKNGTPCHE